MKFSRYIGDMSIDLEGKPEEIIQVLKYLDVVENKKHVYGHGIAKQTESPMVVVAEGAARYGKIEGM